MNETTTKELLAINYIKTIVEFSGFISSVFSKDIGDDIAIQKVLSFADEDGIRYFSAGEILCFQVKCTTSKKIQLQNDQLKFRLKVKNFNHLVLRLKRWKINSYAPLVLILVVLPDDGAESWLGLDDEKGWLTIKGKAFWYVPEPDQGFSKNKTHQWISVSPENQISLFTLKEVFESFFKQSI